MKGKKGPVPEMIDPPVENEPADAKIYACRTCEFMGSEEESVAHMADNRDHVIAEVEDEESGERPVAVPLAYRCEEKACLFTGSFEEWNEHSAGTGHVIYNHVSIPTEPEQQELFAGRGILEREIQEPISDGYIEELRARLVEMFQSKVGLEDEKKEIDGRLSRQIKDADEEMRRIAKILREPFETKFVDWRMAPDRSRKREGTVPHGYRRTTGDTAAHG